MTKKFRLLLLDANIVIKLFQLGIWEQILSHCDVHLSRTIASRESKFYCDEDGVQYDIDLTIYEQNNQINVFDVSLSQDAELTKHFDITYLERFDPGEREALAHLVTSKEQYVICSADSIVFKVLGYLSRAEQGISLEEILQRIGLRRDLTWQFSKNFREKYTKEGFVDSLSR
ncbi:MAG: hypothetical protein JXA11_12450 [Phycisphaerae bacterium]|nr:hypothetical protein [Phycisphaerae bacterium]